MGNFEKNQRAILGKEHRIYHMDHSVTGTRENFDTVYEILCKMQAISNQHRQLMRGDKNKVKDAKYVDNSLKISVIINKLDKKLYEDELIKRYTASDETVILANELFDDLKEIFTIVGYVAITSYESIYRDMLNFKTVPSSDED